MIWWLEMSASEIARALRGLRVGVSWMAHCPAHEDQAPSLSISSSPTGKVLVHCHAGCDQRDVIAALRARGLWDTAGTSEGVFGRKHHRTIFNETVPEAPERTAAAVAVWQECEPADGSPLEIHLRWRGLRISPPSALRFHPGLWHPARKRWPAMVALVTQGETGLPLAIHRTFLDRDGPGKAPVCPQKMMLGPCRGGVVRLGEPSAVLMVGEGIETCLAAMQATGHAAWAALSTSGLRSLNLPRDVHDVIVLADGDDPGEAAARDCARRWMCEGRCVRIARPPKGMDFNDMLMGRVAEGGG